MVLFGVGACLLQHAACASPLRERILYEQQGVRVSLQEDPSISPDSRLRNEHPAQMTPEQLTALLRTLEIRGFWSRLVGSLSEQESIPVFKDQELQMVASPLSTALSQAGPRELVSFSVQKSDAAALTVDTTSTRDRPRTDGRLFLRGPYLHLVVTDHVAFTGAELRLAEPVQTASLRPAETPDWGKIGKLHFSVNVKEALAAQAAHAAAAASASSTEAVAAQPVPAGQASVQADKGMIEDLRLQVRELTISNAELRSRLQTQAKEMKSLKDELTRTRRDLADSQAKARARR